MMNFSSLLRYLRESIGISQKQISQSIGISSSAYSQYECGTRLPEIKILAKLALFYHVNINIFLFLMCLEPEMKLNLTSEELYDIFTCDMNIRARHLDTVYDFTRLSDSFKEDVFDFIKSAAECIL